MADLSYIPRYQEVSPSKSSGSTYTPENLARFVAEQIVSSACLGRDPLLPINIMDPALGDGALLLSLLQALSARGFFDVNVYGFETNKEAFTLAWRRLQSSFPKCTLMIQQDDFLKRIGGTFDITPDGSSFCSFLPPKVDLLIANPPYVRTQVLGSDASQFLARQFGLTGRVDLYHAFLHGIPYVLKPHGVAGVIVSNRFMTTQSGQSVRKSILDRFSLLHVWDLGDTKLFDVAVLPAVLLLQAKSLNSNPVMPRFTSIYQAADPDEAAPAVNDPLDALNHIGTVTTPNGRAFSVKQGVLDHGNTQEGTWRLSLNQDDSWLQAVSLKTWARFADIGRIHVGVKTTADPIFIRNWEEIPADRRPELLRPLTNRGNARRYKALPSNPNQLILYPHQSFQGRTCAISLDNYPRTKDYLESHRARLESRKYLRDANRQWYEIWVPQDPEGWSTPKLVFPDISETPTFWIDFSGSVVNGDCYWLSPRPGTDPEILWLCLAIANSTFSGIFYDLRYNNKLYSGRRRFIKQYVDEFPLPSPTSSLGMQIIQIAKRIFDLTPSRESDNLQTELDMLVFSAFDVSKKIWGNLL